MAARIANAASTATVTSGGPSQNQRRSQSRARSVMGRFGPSVGAPTGGYGRTLVEGAVGVERRPLATLQALDGQADTDDVAARRRRE